MQKWTLKNQLIKDTVLTKWQKPHEISTKAEKYYLWTTWKWVQILAISYSKCYSFSKITVYLLSTYYALEPNSWIYKIIKEDKTKNLCLSGDYILLTVVIITVMSFFFPWSDLLWIIMAFYGLQLCQHGVLLPYIQWITTLSSCHCRLMHILFLFLRSKLS